MEEIKKITQYEKEQEIMFSLLKFYEFIGNTSLRGLEDEDVLDSVRRPIYESLIQMQEALKAFENKLPKPLKFAATVEPHYGWGDNIKPVGYTASLNEPPWHTDQKMPQKSYLKEIQAMKEHARSFPTDYQKRPIVYRVYRTEKGALWLANRDYHAFFGESIDMRNVIYVYSPAENLEGEREF